jgi:hypothetical protein
MEADMESTLWLEKPFTVMLWIPKGELRVVDATQSWRSETHKQEFKFLPEHSGRHKPWFKTAEEAWQFIREEYPHLQP